MNEGFTRILMPGYMLRHHRMGHPVMGEIGPRRIAVFIGHAYRSVLDGSSFGSRSVLVRFSIVLRSFFVHPSFGNRRTIENRTKNERRMNEDVTITHRC